MVGIVAAGAAASGAPELPGQQVFRSDIDVVAVGRRREVRQYGRSRALTSRDFQLIDNGELQIDRRGGDRGRAGGSDAHPRRERKHLDGHRAIQIESQADCRHAAARRSRAAHRVLDRRHRSVSAAARGLDAAGRQVASHGGTSLHDALLLSLARAPVEGRRQLIIAFTDGLDTTS
jgi:hypothetical protein